MREFIEPFLRRVIAITLKPLPTQKVLEILSKKFKKEVALLLAQIYDDTVNAGLRKPATLQELFQLGEVLESSPSVPLDELLKMFIIKYDDDWVKYKQYIVSRKMFEFLNRTERKLEDGVSKHYEPPEHEIDIQSQQQAEATNSVNQVLEKIAKVVVKQPQKLPEAREDVKEDIEATFKAQISENNVGMYTTIVKELRPEPSNTGDIIGKFRVVKNGTETSIISNEPLSLSEYVKLLNGANNKFEAYIEERVFLLNPVSIDNMLHRADNIYYYSNRVIRVEKMREHSSELVEVELTGDSYSPRREKVSLVEAVVRAYVNVDPRSARQPLILEEVMPEKVCRATVRDIDEYEKIIDKCIEVRGFDIKVISEPQRISEVISKISKIAGDHGLSVRVSISPGEKIKSVGAYRGRENEIIIYSPDW
jgi:ferritin-like protein